jgi:hypothetical protein
MPNGNDIGNHPSILRLLIPVSIGFPFFIRRSLSFYKVVAPLSPKLRPDKVFRQAIGTLHAVPLVHTRRRMMAVAVGHTYLARLILGRFSFSIQGNELQGVSRLNSQRKKYELTKCVITAIDPPGMAPISGPLH